MDRHDIIKKRRIYIFFLDLLNTHRDHQEYRVTNIIIRV